MADETIRDVYQLDIDQAALNRVKQGIASGRKFVDDMTSAIKQQSVTATDAVKNAAKYADELDKVEKTARKASKVKPITVIDFGNGEVARQVETTTKAVEDYTQATKEATVAQEELAQAAQKTASGSAANKGKKPSAEVSGGSAQKLFSTGAQLAGALGGGGVVSQAISTAGGVTDTLRELPKLQEAIKGLSPVSVATGAGVAALTVALALYNQEQARTKAAALAEIDSRQKALTLLQTGSRDEIQARINQLAKQAEINKATAADANKLFQDIKDNTLKELGPAAAAAEFYASKVGLAAGPYAAAAEAADKANKNVDSTTTELTLLEKQSGLTAQSLEDIATAAQKIQYIGDDISNRASADLEAYRLANEGTSEQLQKRIRDLQLETAVLSNNIDMANAQADALGRNTDEGKKAADSADALTKQFNTAQTSLNALSQSFIQVSISAREAAEFTKKQDQEKIAAVKTYQEAEKKAITESNKAKGEALGRLNEAQVKAADEAAKAAEKALQTLIDKKADLAKDLSDSFIDDDIKRQREENDAKIKLAQDEARAARDHANEMRDIQAKSKRDERKLLDERDFVALFELRQNTQDELKEKQDKYIQDRKDANEDAEIAAKDRAVQYQREREDRLTQYQRNLRDAQAQYNKEIQAAATNKTQQLQLAQQAYNATLNQLNAKLVTEQRLNLSAYDAALKAAATGAQARIDIEAKTQAALLQLANNRLSAIQNGGSGVTVNGRIVSGAKDNTRIYGGQIAVARAGGGGVSQGQWFSYNEKQGQRESFNGAMLPAGAGLAYAARSGYVNPNGGGKSITVNGPLVAPVIHTGASEAQLGGLEKAIYNGALQAIQDTFGSN